jgi:hypothetical protein
MPADAGDFVDGGGLDAGPGSFGEGGQALVDGGMEACTGAAQQARLRFEQAQVVAPAVCTSETQKRTCSGGNFTAWSGTFSAESCELAPYASCGSVVHGAQEKRTRYQVATASSVDDCKAETQTRTCDDGVFDEWTGSYQAESCQVSFLGGCSLFGSSFSCETGTTCMFKAPISAICLGAIGHGCGANGDCVSGTCALGTCTLRSSPGQACDEQADCAGCVGSGTSVSCAQNSCRCSDTSTCTANDQCLGTCVSNKCVAANTTCDNSEDCRDAYQCTTPAGKTKGCYLPDGQACAANSACAHVCRGALCAALGQKDEDCDENVDCKSGLTCRAGKCAALATVGLACEESADCEQTQLMPLICAPYVAGAITFQACLVASGGACGSSNTACASGVCSSSGSGPTGICQ